MYMLLLHPSWKNAIQNILLINTIELKFMWLFFGCLAWNPRNTNYTYCVPAYAGEADGRLKIQYPKDIRTFNYRDPIEDLQTKMGEPDQHCSILCKHGWSSSGHVYQKVRNVKLENNLQNLVHSICQHFTLIYILYNFQLPVSHLHTPADSLTCSISTIAELLHLSQQDCSNAPFTPECKGQEGI